MATRLVDLTDEMVAALDSALHGYDPDPCDHDEHTADPFGDDEHMGWCPAEVATLHDGWSAILTGADWTCHLGHATTPPVTIHAPDTTPEAGESVEIRYCPTCRQEIRTTPEPCGCAGGAFGHVDACALA